MDFWLHLDLKLGSLFSHNHLVLSTYPASFRSMTPSPPWLIGVQTVGQETAFFPHMAVSLPDQRKFRLMASSSSMTQADSLSDTVK